MPKPRKLYLVGEYDGGSYEVIARSDGYYVSYSKRVFYLKGASAASDISHDLVVACLARKLKVQQSQGGGHAADCSSGHAPRLAAEAASLASEVSGFVVDLVAKRPRVEPERLDTRPEDAGTAAAVNRDHDAKRRHRVANKQRPVEEGALQLKLLRREEELVGLPSEDDEMGTDTVVDDMGDQSLKVLLGAFGPSLRTPFMSALLGDVGQSARSLIMELLRASAQVSEGASFLAASKGLVISKAERARQKVRPLAVELGSSLIESRVVSQGKQINALTASLKEERAAHECTAQTWGEFDGSLAGQQGRGGRRLLFEFQEPALPPGGGSARSIDELRP